MEAYVVREGDPFYSLISPKIPRTSAESERPLLLSLRLKTEVSMTSRGKGFLGVRGEKAKGLTI